MPPATNPVDNVDSLMSSSEREKYYESIRDRAQALVSTIGNDPKVHVQVGERGKGDYFSPKKKLVNLDPNDIDRDVNEILGITAHEAMHVRITQWEHVPDKLRETLGFNQLIQTLEDTRVNTANEVMFPGAGEWLVQAVTQETTRIGGRLNLQEIMERERRTNGFVPRALQFCVEAQKRWAYKTHSHIDDPDVQEALNKTTQALEDLRNEIPDKDASKMEIELSAKKELKILSDQIWPVYQQLIAKDIEDQKIVVALREFIQDSLDIAETKDGLTEEESKELDLYLQKTRELMEMTNYLDLQKMSPGLRAKLAKRIKEKDNKKTKSNQAKGKGEEGATQDNLTIQQKAEQHLKDLEDKVVENLRAGLLDKSLQETHATRLKQQNDAKELERATEEANRIHRLQQYEIEFDKEAYDKAYTKVAPYIDGIYAKLSKILQPQQYSHWQSGYANGERVNVFKAMQFEQNRGLYNKLFERKTIPNIRNTKFQIVIDRSGSMEEDFKQDLCFQATVLLAEVLSRLQVDIEIIYFDDFPETDVERETYVAKPFGKRLDKESRNNIEKFGTSAGLGTDLGPAVKWSANRLSKTSAIDKFLIVLTDGEESWSPNPGERIDEVVRQLQNIDLFLLGIGLGTEGSLSVNRHFPNHIEVPDVEKLAAVLADKIQDMLLNPQKYRQ